MAEPPFRDSYLAAATDFTEMVSPLAVPVTFACSQASLFSSPSEALSEVSRVYTLSPTTKAYLAPFCTQARTQSAGAIPPSVCLAPHMASLTFPVKVWALPAATPGTIANPAKSTTTAVQTCNIRKRDIFTPPEFVLGLLRAGCVRMQTRNTYTLLDSGLSDSLT